MAVGSCATRGRALVFKDNGLVALDTRETLLELGFAEVAVAARSPEALAQIASARPDWAVLDAGLPPADLAAVIAALDAARVPFVLVCSNPDGSDLGADGKGRTFLARPYGMAELEKLLPARA